MPVIILLEFLERAEKRLPFGQKKRSSEEELTLRALRTWPHVVFMNHFVKWNLTGIPSLLHFY